MNNFEHHIAQLKTKGFSIERGMLVGAFDDKTVIGVRFVSANTQVDSYLQNEFFDADKSHVSLGTTESIVGPEGIYYVSQILAKHR